MDPLPKPGSGVDHRWRENFTSPFDLPFHPPHHVTDHPPSSPSLSCAQSEPRRRYHHFSGPSPSSYRSFKTIRRKRSFVRAASAPIPSSPTPHHRSPVALSTSARPPTPDPRQPQPSLPLFLARARTFEIPRPAPTSPSLSSTIDTLPSTPALSPIHRFDEWCHDSVQHPGGDHQDTAWVEPVRSKRRFDRFKRAKRLPHPRDTSHSNSAGDIYQVHAAVFPCESQEHASHPSTHHERPHSRLDCDRDGRSAHTHIDHASIKPLGFHHSTPDKHASPPPDKQRELPTLTSSFSLSNFRFPPPPGRTWAGALGPCLSLANKTQLTSNRPSSNPAR